MIHRFLAGALAALALTGCVSSVPRIKNPRVQDMTANCPEHYPRPTAIASVISTVKDEFATGPMLSLPETRKAIKENTGVEVRWADQVLLLPKTAKALGEDGDFVHLHEAIIANQAATKDYRIVWLLVRDHGKDAWHPFRAYDMQNVCVEGERLA